MFQSRLQHEEGRLNPRIHVTSHGVWQYVIHAWTLTKAHMELLSITQRKMMRIMVVASPICDHKRNPWMLHQTGVNDIIDVIKKGVHGWAGHIVRFKESRWTNK